MSIRKAVFPAAGHGTRFLPATKAQPKEMLPLVDKPLIQHCVEEVVSSGVRDILIVTGRGKHSIEDHFDVSYELQELLRSRGKLEELKKMKKIVDMAKYFYVRQNMPLGLGHAVLQAKNFVGDEDFVVVLGDDIIDSEKPVTAQLIEAYQVRGRGIYLAVERVDPKEVDKYGIVSVKNQDGKVYEVEDMVEKPSPEEAPSNLAIIGRYILPPEIFPALEETPPGKGGEIQLTDAMKKLLGKVPVYAVEFEGTRYDSGNKLGFLKANVVFALKREDLREGLVDFLRQLAEREFAL
ncbi:MAG: UTP--glucose-1-phosphate uridylyltransferase [Deltaproteobacteria bacterium]|nr:MAG: UTP--glucose-1-phosphate uridylyltransferase [Deltaproteobacteria bacterium]